jgi:glycosyltransferase A (GT-A) superfamily protein (DUF2064 family)
MHTVYYQNGLMKNRQPWGQYSTYEEACKMAEQLNWDHDHTHFTVDEYGPTTLEEFL